MITPLLNEMNTYVTSFTIGCDSAAGSSLKFRFEFRQRPGFWLYSDWFEISTTEVSHIRLLGDFLTSKRYFDSIIESTDKDRAAFFKEFNDRWTLDERIELLRGDKPLHNGLTSLEIAYAKYSRLIGRAKTVLAEIMNIEDLCLLKLRQPATYKNTFFAHRRGTVWESLINLSKAQWKVLIDSEIEHRGIREAGEAPVLGVANLRAISADVRREVWRRDQGRCMECGSQDRIEYDHIVPVALGGGTTSRNIRLLCEQCNRRKGARIA